MRHVDRHTMGRAQTRPRQGLRGSQWKTLTTIFLVAVLGIFCFGQSRDEGVSIGPYQGVSFAQVSFEFMEAKEPFSAWGRVTVDPERVAAATGLAQGYLNVSTEMGWVVWNLPFSVEDPSGPISSYFALSRQGGEPVGQLPATVNATSEPISTFDRTATTQFSNRSTVFPVERAMWNAEGVGGPVWVIDAAPALADYYADISRMIVPLHTQHTQPNAVNVQCAVNQCFPMSIANSLQYLENRYGISIPHNHQAGLRGDNTLVGKLDTYANRTASSRTNGSGVWFQPMLNGKFEYLSDNGLTNSLVHRHQGRGYGSASAGQALPAGNFTRHGITSTDDGAAVTFNWLCEQIQKGEDVELVFSYDNSSGQPTGGHAVRVFECGTTLGVPWIGYLHDAQQSNDTAGLETVRVNVTDLDGDGTLNLGTTSREIRFAMSESRVEPLIAIPIIPDITLRPLTPVRTAARTLVNIDIVNTWPERMDDIELIFYEPFSPEWITDWYDGWGAPPEIGYGSGGAHVRWASPRMGVSPGQSVHIGLELAGTQQFESLINAAALWSIGGQPIFPIPIPWQSWRVDGNEVVDLIYLSPAFDDAVQVRRWFAVVPEPIPLSQLLWEQSEAIVHEIGGRWLLVDNRPVTLYPGQDPLELLISADAAAVLVRYEVLWKEEVISRVINELIF